MVNIRNLDTRKVLKNKDLLIKNIKRMAMTEDCSGVRCSQCIFASYYNRYDEACGENLQSTVYGGFTKRDLEKILNFILYYNKNEVFEI